MEKLEKIASDILNIQLNVLIMKQLRSLMKSMHEDLLNFDSWSARNKGGLVK
jgi:hypothetical protein